MDAAPDPQWAEIPRKGTLHGLKRGMLYILAVPCRENDFNPPVLSISVKSGKKCKRGKRLINVPSLLAHLESLARRSD